MNDPKIERIIDAADRLCEAVDRHIKMHPQDVPKSVRDAFANYLEARVYEPSKEER